jgi:hypothetical protein
MEPILRNDTEISKYTRAVSRQRLGKHVPAAKNMHPKIEVILETVFCSSCARGLQGEQLKQEHFNWKGVVVQRGLELGNRGLVIVRSRYQETSSEDTVGWKKFTAMHIARCWCTQDAQRTARLSCGGMVTEYTHNEYCDMLLTLGA